MEDLPDLLFDLLAFSGGFWMLFTLFKFSSVSRFIVRRYEKETNLLDTVFFMNHFTFVRYLPDLHSTGLYAMHLVMCTWGWRFCGKKKLLRKLGKVRNCFKNTPWEQLVANRLTALAGLPD